MNIVEYIRIFVQRVRQVEWRERIVTSNNVEEKTTLVFKPINVAPPTTERVYNMEVGVPRPTLRAPTKVR